MESAVILIDGSTSTYQLGINEIDETHQEFIVLVNALAIASKDDFISLFHDLYEHTILHFARENELMVESSFPAIAEHDADHQRILGELDRFNNKVSKGQIAFARAYVRDNLPGWFELHLSTMDSALVAHLNKQ